jgi:hypothetical protein
LFPQVLCDAEERNDDLNSSTCKDVDKSVSSVAKTNNAEVTKQ